MLPFYPGKDYLILGYLNISSFLFSLRSSTMWPYILYVNDINYDQATCTTSALLVPLY